MGVEYNPNSRWYNYVYIEGLKKKMSFLNLIGLQETQSAIIIQRWWRRLKEQQTNY